MRKMSRFAIALAVLGGLFGVGQEVKAGLLPVNVTDTQDGANFRYSYGVVLTSDATLKTGDYFTVYDFAGAIPGSNVQPAGFTFSTQNVGVTPSGTLPTDDPKIANVTWTYTGATTSVGQSNLGTFSVDSQIGTPNDGVFTSQTHRQIDGRVDANITEAQVPVPAGPVGVPASVPEPATLALVGIGLPLVGFFRRRRRHS